MSGFKTPTAMSPPKVQPKSPLFRSPSVTTPLNLPNTGHQSDISPQDAMPGLMRAFEELKSPSPAQTSPTAPRLPPIIHNRVAIPRGGRGEMDGPSDAIVLAANGLQGEATADIGVLLVGRESAVSSPSPSSKRSTSDNNVENGTRRTVIPHAGHGLRSPASPTHDTSTTGPESPFKAYRHISESVARKSPYGKPLPQPPPWSPELEVYKRHESNGRLMVCEAREEHCSRTVTNFVGERTGLRGIAELKSELLRTLGRLGDGEGGRERARGDLKVVTGNMLERIVAWDLNRAEALEQVDVPLLSTVPTAASLNRVDAFYIIKMFRSGMLKTPENDVRWKIGKLPDQDLMALLHYTLLISRPVLAWELDLDEI